MVFAFCFSFRNLNVLPRGGGGFKNGIMDSPQRDNHLGQNPLGFQQWSISSLCMPMWHAEREAKLPSTNVVSVENWFKPKSKGV